MNLYLTVIGIISTLSCILIIICINSKTSDSLPSDSSKSPIKRQGLTQTQKNQILMIVCVIFFMSLVTTNVKTAKFSVMVHNMMTSGDQNADEEEVKDLGEVFYGRKGNCEFRSEFKDQYPNLSKHLSQSSLQKSFLQTLTQKNIPNSQYILNPKPQLNQHQTLLILQSQQNSNLNSQIHLPHLSQHLCQSKTPVLYLNPKHKLQSQQQLMHLLKMDSYSTLKQSLCKINGIEVKTEMEKVGGYFFEKDQYERNQGKNIEPNAFLIVENFENLAHVLVYDHNVHLASKQAESDQVQGTFKREFPSFAAQYQTFGHKILFDLIQNCRINVILHTNQEQSNKLYNFWQQFTKNAAIVNQQAKYLKKAFPFVVSQQKGLSKLQLQNMLMTMLQKSQRLKNNKQQILKQFQKSFTKTQFSQTKKSKSLQQSPFSRIANQHFSLQQIELFFSKVSEIIDKDSSQNKVKKPKPVTYEETVADINGMLEEYLMVRSQFSSRWMEHGLSVGGLRKKLALKDLVLLERIGLVRIKQGRAYLLEKDNE